MFYLPQVLWKTWEGGIISFLSKDLSSPLKEVWMNDRKTQLYGYFVESIISHNFYAIRYLFCEFLNLFNAVNMFSKKLK